ncbi:MAG: glycine zipper 2TM domain-containing protein [Zoogloeaceae bacterium]|jgi:hypothetical protein|nr:glycine zipper 2TM domain-containing protein [Zoogloeaceae bacterium]
MKRYGKFIFPLFMAAMLLFPSGCAEMSTKQGQGTVIGAVVGAAVGAAADGKRGAAIGAVLGGVVGNRIGAYLDERDLETLKKLEQEALKSDQQKSFKAQKSGETVTITPGPEEQEVVTYGLSPNIREYELTPASEEAAIRAHVDTPLYAGADARQTPRLVLKEGDSLFVPAHVAGKPGWGAAVERNVVVGYVPLSYLDAQKAKPYKAPVPRQAKKKEAAPAQGASQTTPAKAPEAAPPASTTTPASTTAPVAASAPADDAPVKQVDVALKCKVTTVRIKGVPEETTRYCQKPPPRWVKT